MRGPSNKSITERSHDKPPRINSTSQNSRNLPTANAPTTSPPPPTPITKARADDLIWSSRDCGEKFIKEGEYPVQTRDSRWPHLGIWRRTTRWAAERGHRSRLDRLPSQSPSSGYRNSKTQRPSGRRPTGVL